MPETTLDLIRRAARGRTVLNASMADLTTLRVGGPADLVVYPADREDLAQILGLLTERSVPHMVLGNGSNLLVRDGGIRGAVLCLTEGFRDLERREGAEPLIRVGAGLQLRRFTRWTVDQAIAGFEGLAGIPGSLGGVLAMNAGAWGTEIGERTVEVEVMDPAGEVRVLPREALRFAYRCLDLPTGSVILGALLRGQAGDPEAIKARVQELYRRREETQPSREHSAGSVFKNPPGRSAGRLIDECGLKGIRVGDAQVSQFHANFIVNLGTATASQVVALMGMIQERVYVKHRVKLEPEIRIVGDWDKGKLRIQE
ncbi:MAG: UDP-N-acetylmuramate dehydrogenase [Deferrisomatales bacterium]